MSCSSWSVGVTVNDASQADLLGAVAFLAAADCERLLLYTPRNFGRSSSAMNTCLMQSSHRNLSTMHTI